MKSSQMAIMLLLFSVSQQTNGQLWKQFSDSAKVFNGQKNTDKAIEYYTKAKKELERDSLWTNSHAQLCNNLAAVYFQREQFEKAEPFLLEARSIKAEIMGKNHPDYLRTCDNLGLLYYSLGDYKKAEPLYLETNLIREKTVGKEHPEYARSCNNLAIIYVNLGIYEKAEPFFLLAKEINQKVLGKENPDYAKLCYNLALIYSEMANYSKAELLHIEAKEINEKALGKQNPEYANSCHSLGKLYVQMGQYQKAEAFYLEGKLIREKILGKNHPEYAASCQDLANLFQILGEYDNAEKLSIEAKQIYEKTLGKMHLDYASSCLNLGGLFQRLGQYDKAEQLYLEAKNIIVEKVGIDHHQYALCCNNLGALYSTMLNYQKAEPLYIEAKQIREKIFGKGHPIYAESCNNLGLLYWKMHWFKMAESLLLESKETLGKVLGKESSTYASACSNLGNLYLEIAKFEDALSLFEEAKLVQEKMLGKEHPAYIGICHSLANLYSVQQNHGKAFEMFEEAFHLQNLHFYKVFQFTSEEEKYSFLKKNLMLENHFFSFNISFESDYKQGFAYDVSLSHRNLILSGSKKLRNSIYDATDTSIKIKYNAWINLREKLAYLYSIPIAKRSADVDSLENQANILEKELTRISQFFEKEQKEGTITWKDIHQYLNPDEAALEFVKFNYYYQGRSTDSIYYIVFLLRKDKNGPIFIDLFESRQIEKLLGSGSTVNTVTAFYRNANKTNAFNLIWKPIERHLEGINRIYYAPTGILNRISFAALPISDHEVLSDKYQLIQLNSTASVIDQSDRVITPNDKISLYGAIQYDVDSSTLQRAALPFAGNTEPTIFYSDENLRGNSWKYLPGTGKEINTIGSLGKQRYYSVTSRSGVQASEESLKALNGSHSPSVLHIATHGFFFPDPKNIEKSNSQELVLGSSFRLSDNPLFRSGLLFSGANNAWNGKRIKGLEDGILTAYEVSNLYMPNTKLVVLSACETGLGEIQGNEGVYGMQRAFKIAGVENLVMSLWKIPDNTTAEFMQEFYKNIFNKQSIEKAFYNAQTILKGRYRKEPYKWAAWVLVR